MSRPFLERARPFLDEGVLAPSDVHTVALVAPRYGEADVERLLGLAFAVRAPRAGHAGVDLGRVAAALDEERLLRGPGRGRGAGALANTELAAGRGSPTAVEEGAAGLLRLEWPDAASWHGHTLGSPLVGAPDERDRPFVAQPLGESSLLLTRRMYQEQERVAAAVRARRETALPEDARLQSLEGVLAGLFPGETASEAAGAVALAARHGLALVVGGPGTGKTFSVSRLLAALLSASRGDQRPVVALAAPTGKAAVRMREALREATAPGATPALAVDEAVRLELQGLPAVTLHRLLGVRPDGSCRHDARNPVPADVVVVDEVSMIDLTSMRRLLEGVRPDARLILLGDRDQLASVEAGCVLADLVGEGSAGALRERVQVFTRSRRFASAPDVSLIAACLQSYAVQLEGVPAAPAERVARGVAVMTGQAHAAAEAHPGERVIWLGAADAAEGSRPARPTEAQLTALARPYTHGFSPCGAGPGGELPGYAALLRGYLREDGGVDPALYAPKTQRALLDALERYRVLAVHRRGALGVVGLEQELSRRVRAFLGHGGAPLGGRHFAGRPLLITENAYDVGLMNGDVGLVLPTARGLEAVFPVEGEALVRGVALSRLPLHEGALAMTVHKAQGSQFERVALVLAGRPSPLQTRELVYTGVTRTRSQLVWLGDADELRVALERRVERASGLSALLEE